LTDKKIKKHDKDIKDLRVAIVHDWLTGMRGGERVLEVLCDIFPKARIFTLLYIKGNLSSKIENMDISTSFVQMLPFIKKYYEYYLPIYPLAVEGFQLNNFDIIISSSHCVAKGVITPPESCSICYCHTPMRYVWDRYYDYFLKDRSIKGLLKYIVKFFSHYLRIWDETSSARVDYFIANSNYVARRIEKFYRRQSEVIYPPVDCSRFFISDEVDDYFLIVSALRPYKRIDIAIDAFNELGLPLKIIGTGKDIEGLKKAAKENIEFLGFIPDHEIPRYFSRCKALIFPGLEDFGIVPLEVQASGRPVIAYSRGGALESVNDGESGIFFHEQTKDSLIEAVLKFGSMSFDPDKIRKQAQKFDRTVFKKKIEKFVFERLEEYNIRINKRQ
jgi:glycosyltransferase involved in cell wall biosynthesis